MEDASLDQAVVWDDVGTFDGRPWRGAVDIVTAGYPCQPFSVAGKRRGADDPRHLWPHVARIVGEIEPPFVFLENVAHHLRLGFPEVASGLVGMGYRQRAGAYRHPSRKAIFVGDLIDRGPRQVDTCRIARGMAPRMRLDLLVNDFTWRAVNDRAVAAS